MEATRREAGVWYRMMHQRTPGYAQWLEHVTQRSGQRPGWGTVTNRHRRETLSHSAGPVTKNESITWTRWGDPEAPEFKIKKQLTNNR